MMNRYALESPYVTSQLNNWIDLIFGYKQKGEAAELANNVFCAYTYPEALDDPEIDPDIAKTAAANFGTCPEQIFKEPHVKKNVKIMNSSYSSDFTVTKTKFKFTIENAVSISTKKNIFYIQNAHMDLMVLMQNI